MQHYIQLLLLAMLHAKLKLHGCDVVVRNVASCVPVFSNR